MTLHSYPMRSLLGDYLRAALGIAIGLGVLLTTPISTVILVVFGGLFAVFALFALRTLQRQLTAVAITDESISDRGLGKRQMSWSELSQFRLRFYGSRRKDANRTGFMQLKFNGGGAAFSFESNIDGFEVIACRAARAARANGVPLDPTSMENLRALGYEGDTMPSIPPA